MKYLDSLKDPIIWKKCNSKDKVMNTQVFGEVGAGKSTSLNRIARLYQKKYSSNKNEQLPKFDAKQSNGSVTKEPSRIEIDKGKLTVIDVPGINDPEAKKEDVPLE